MRDHHVGEEGDVMSESIADLRRQLEAKGVKWAPVFKAWRNLREVGLREHLLKILGVS